MTVHEFAGVQTQISYRKLEPVPYWLDRVALFMQVQNSKEIYKDMEPLVRQLIASRIKFALEAMYDNVDEWLPSAFTFSEGDTLDVHFRITKTNIESDVKHAEKVTSFKLKEASEDLREMMAQMELEDEAIDSQK